MMATAHRTSKLAKGFTLVEIMVAMTIGLIILGAVAQIFATSRSTYSLEEGLARVQENARFAMEFVAGDVRMAGYAGCLNINQASNSNVAYSVNNQLQTPNFATNFAPGLHIQAHSASGSIWTPALPAALTASGPTPLPDTDVLIIRRANDLMFPLDIAMGTVDDPVTIDAADATALELQQNDVVLLADCNNLDIFQITNTDPTSGTLAHDVGPNQDGNLSRAYGTNSEVMKLLTRAYFIGTGASGGPALFRSEGMPGGNMIKRELVDNVESMRVIYGEDTDASADATANRYRLPGTVTNWDRVVSIRVAMLIRSPDESGPDMDTNVYNLLGDTVSASDDFDPEDDRRRRRVFSSTIQLRNLRTN